MALWPFQTMREVAVLSPHRAAPYAGLLLLSILRP